MEQREQPERASGEGHGEARVSAAIDRWQRELLDLSRNNRLLYFQTAQGPGRRGQGGVGIVQPAPAELFDRLANREKAQTIARPAAEVQATLDLTAPTPRPREAAPTPQSPPPCAGEGEPVGANEGAQVIAPAPAIPRLRRDEILLDADPARLDALLYRLRLRARSALLEQGIDILYVAFGLLEWSGAGTAAATAGERVMSPLLLLPVRLDRARSVDPYTLTPLDEQPILNPALVFQLSSAFQLSLTLPEADDDGDLDLPSALACLAEQVAVRPDWSVREGAYLGLFSFAKQAMYADLEANRERLVNHPIVRALAGDPAGLPRVVLPEADRLDEQEQPRETFQVLDADASQRTVLAAIRRGGNLVVQGPPGTGKSQTIANVIAEAMARGKSALFVSEKLAALQVVAKRLRAAGLGDFCLEAHGHGGDKAAIVKALASALPEIPSSPPSPRLDDLQRLAERRAVLNAYAQALHDDNTPLGASAFAIHGELAKRAGAPRILFDLPQIGALTGERVMRLAGLVRRLEPLADVVTAPEQHPWYGCTLPRWNPLVQAQLDTTLDRLARAADELAEIQATTAARWGLSPEPSLAGAHWLLGVVMLLDGRPPALSRWLTRPTTAELIEQARTWSVRCEGYSQRRLRLLSHYRETVFELDLPSIVGALERVEVGAIGRLHGDGPAADRALAARSAVEDAAGRVQRAIPATLAAATDLAERLGLAAPASRDDVGRLLQIADLLRADPRPEPAWLEPGRLGLLADLAAEAARQYEREAAGRAALAERFDDSVVTAITPELAERIETTYASWLRHLRPGWYADIGMLRRHLRTERAAEGLDYAGAAAAIGQWRQVTAAETWLSTQATALAGAFGRHYLGSRTDWIGIQGATEVVRRLTDLLGDLTRRPRVAALLLESGAASELDRPAETLRAALADLDAALADLNRVAEFDRSPGEALAPRPPLPAAGEGEPADDVLPSLAHGAVGMQGMSAQPIVAPRRGHGGMDGAGGRSFSSRPLTEHAADLEQWLAALAPLWAAADALHGARRHTTISAADLLAEARDALACPVFEHDFGAAMPGLVAELGPFFKGLKTDWTRVLEALAWTGRLRACFEGEPPSALLAALDAEPPGPLPERAALSRALGRFQELREEIGASFGAANGEASGATRGETKSERGPRIGSYPIDRATLPAVAAWARSHHAALPRLQEWIDAQTLLAEMTAAGLGGFVRGLIREAPSGELWGDIFLRQVFTLWLTWRYERAPSLARFRRQEHEATIQEVCQLDRHQWELAAERISATLLAKRPGRAGVAMNGSEVGLLLREARKQRRFKPLRRLFAELPHLLPQLKPCLLMSPLSVAQHLGDSAATFDLVVFDEASQILPADAIGAIGRGKQIVVVGDRRQLPPTRFFQVTTLDTQTDDPDEEPPESVLDACLNAGLPECSLLWHYRSRHEHLIAFSNASFYDGRLRTFPSPDADERVVTFQHVPSGVYDRGGTRANRAEAVAVADLVVEHVERQASVPAEQRLSLGVIAFSEAQMLAILSELEARKRARPDLEPLLVEEGGDGAEGLEGLFVKNLESVQGDERDVILFSIGYGRDADGRLTMSFGPLNAPGGERRLNVAVTRARRRLTVVASIRSHEIDGSPERPAGVRQLKRYLEYAEHGPAAVLGSSALLPGQTSGVTHGRATTPFEEAVQAALAATLQDEGMDVVARVGVGEQPVDLAVRDGDGRYLLAIESDGETFALAPTARDRDRLRQEVLERLGWQVHRIWSTAWVAAQREETERVRAAATRARQIRDGVLVDDLPLSVLKPEDQPSQGPARPNTRPPSLTERTRQPALTPRPPLPALANDGVPPLRGIPVSGEGEPVGASLAAPAEEETGTGEKAGEAPDEAGGASPAPTLEAGEPRAMVGAQFIAPDPATAPATPIAPATATTSASVNPLPSAAHEGAIGGGDSPGGGASSRPGGSPDRPIDKVPEAEIVEAVRAVLARAFAMPAPDLAVAVARELGYQRTGARIRGVVGRVAEQMLRDGALVEAGGHLRLAGS